MRIEIELEGFNGFGWMVCDKCPLLIEYEWGDACALEYTGYLSGKELCQKWLNTVTGEWVKPDILNTNYAHVEGIEYVIVRPQECIDKHGK